MSYSIKREFYPIYNSAKPVHVRKHSLTTPVYAEVMITLVSGLTSVIVRQHFIRTEHGCWEFALYI